MRSTIRIAALALVLAALAVIPAATEVRAQPLGGPHALRSDGDRGGNGAEARPSVL